MYELKRLLRNECAFSPSDEVLDAFISLGELVAFEAGDVLIQAGCCDPNVYVVKDGIIRFVDMNGEKERTFAFGTPGTVFMSKHSFVHRSPSYYQVEACCASALLRIGYDKYWALVERNGQFALWMLHLAYEELMFQEYKNSTINNGSARERFCSLLAKRPEILGRVPQKVIASYLDITPEYLSRLRKKYRLN